MAMQINTNILSMIAQRNVGMNESRLGTAIERLSTGLRINSARDDAAGMAISERFTSQIRGQTVAQRNANDAISLAQTAEGALGVLGDALQRMRELTVQSLNGMNTDGDRAAIQQEIVQLREEIERIAQDTTFNGKEILNGTLGAMNFQIGSERGDVLAITGLNARASALTGTQKAVSSSNLADGFDYATLTNLTINSTNVDLSSVTTRAGAIEKINQAFDGTVQAKAAGTTSASFAYSPQTQGSFAYSPQTQGSFTYQESGTGAITINGEPVTLNDGLGGPIDIDAAITAINAVTATTGVAATKDGADIVFTDATGAAIELTNEAGSVFGDNAATIDNAAAFQLNGTTIDLTTGTPAEALDIDAAIAKINQSSATTGVTASKDGGNIVLTDADGAAIELTGEMGNVFGLSGVNTTINNAAAFQLNGTTIDLTAGTPAEALDIDAAIAKINESSATTGVTASKDGGNIVLTDADGGDIAIANETGTAFGGSAAGTYEAGIEISSNLDSLTVEGAAASALGLNSNNVASQTLKLSEVSVATVFDANNALMTIDSAIDQVTSLRAELGAMQNRFENVVEVISVHRENLEAARSRIRDADFAAETANLTRAQILQQAGISSLAQANSAPQSVLSLLQ